ncbi:hypothetical protein NZ698_04345 [Chryseobacterium sp. PBS4-4]|uniref:DUF4625 domain-containing protein n=1 Tax=Chryseobacterium edaphi TaxID=2976532 RepID=A0ABT2W2G8_9FLAO|nr:hypothetical protein [Chryseobacterium edaphi]MCU7616417.1 hypothetical protein [Chryseobacterium edaphi]
MKTLFNTALSVIFVGISLVSCKDDDDYETIQSTEKVKIDSVKIINDTMSVFSVQSIRTYSTYASQCDGFYGYDYIHTGNFTRDVTAYQYHTNGSCAQANHVSANQINFSPQQAGTYTFKFWTGNNTWITKTIVVE